MTAAPIVVRGRAGRRRRRALDRGPRRAGARDGRALAARGARHRRCRRTPRRRAGTRGAAELGPRAHRHPRHRGDERGPPRPDARDAAPRRRAAVRHVRRGAAAALGGRVPRHGGTARGRRARRRHQDRPGRRRRGLRRVRAAPARRAGVCAGLRSPGRAGRRAASAADQLAAGRPRPGRRRPCAGRDAAGALGVEPLRAALELRARDATRGRLANVAQTTVVAAELALAELDPGLGRARRPTGARRPRS